MKKHCEHCKQIIEYEKPQQLGAHKTNCEFNFKRREKTKIKFDNLNIKYLLECKKCGKKYELVLTELQFKKGNYRKNCSRSCANSRVQTARMKKKLSLTIKKTRLVRDNVLITCKNCGCKIEVPYSSRNHKFCSKKCGLQGGGRLGGLKSSQMIVKRSKNEVLFADLCKNMFEAVRCNESIFNGWDADIILDKERIAVLWNGPWHYRKITNKHSVDQVQNRDRIKVKEIMKCGYSPYIIKDDGKFNEEFVKNEFKRLVGVLSLNE